MIDVPTEIGPIIMIGPMKAGKSTVGGLLAARLAVPFVSLDVLERQYAVEAGRATSTERLIWAEKGVAAWYAYRREFFDEAVLRFLAEHRHGILELGGGHPILPDEQKQARVSLALAPYRNVVLLMPEPDLARSLAILKLRQNPERLDPDRNEVFLHDRRYFDLAEFVVYTEGLSPEQTCELVLAVVTARSNGSDSRCGRVVSD